MLEYDISQFVHWVGNIRAKINYVSAFCCWQYSQFLMPTFDKRAQWQKKPNKFEYCLIILIDSRINI